MPGLRHHHVSRVIAMLVLVHGNIARALLRHCSRRQHATIHHHHANVSVAALRDVLRRISSHRRHAIVKTFCIPVYATLLFYATV